MALTGLNLPAQCQRLTTALVAAVRRSFNKCANQGSKLSSLAKAGVFACFPLMLGFFQHWAAKAALVIAALPLYSTPALANPYYWRHDSNRWAPGRWSPSEYHNHWIRPCGGVGCDPRSWGPRWSHHCSGLGCDPQTWSWSGYRRWGWWSQRSAAWDIAGLAAGAMIMSAVSNARQSNQPTIVIPESSYQLQYNSVQPITSNGIRFVVSRNGVTYQMDADCQDGELNGNAPNTAAEAQLLNAACQIAYGS